VVIDAVGRPETWKQAFYARDLAGTVVLVGVPTPEMMIPEIPLIDVFGRGGSLKSSWYGDCLPSRDFPMLVDLYRQGRLDLDAFVSEEIGIGDVEAAFEKMHRGEVLRSVVLFAALAVTGRMAAFAPLPLALGLLAYAGVSEVLQSVLPLNRDGDLLDVLADALGVLTGMLATRLRRGARGEP
jgi:hypothetical protein